MIRNRIHCVIDRHPLLERPAVKDIFSNEGKAWMKRAPLPPADRTLLDDDFAIHALLQTQVSALEKNIVADNTANPLAVRLQTLPGVGKNLAPVVADRDRPDRALHGRRLTLRPCGARPDDARLRRQDRARP